jgi:parallel beta-helix repeat protein
MRLTPRPGGPHHPVRRRRVVLFTATVVVLAAGGVAGGRFVRDRLIDDRPPPTDPGARPVSGQSVMPDPAGGAGVPAATACAGVHVRPGGDVQKVLDDARPGTRICFARGVYRLRAPLRPKDGQQLVGAPGAVLSGARPVGGWTRDGRAWMAKGGLPRAPEAVGDCRAGSACRFGETVLRDGRPLARVMNRSDLSAGRFYEDYGNDRIWLADDPNGHRIEVATASAAVKSSARAVTVEGLTVEAFANPAQAGAIESEGAGWTIRHNEIRYNHGVGVITFAGGRVLENYVHHNGQLGLGGQGANGLVEGNEIDHNNTAGFDFLWEAGGAKWVDTRGLVVRRNSVHDNIGPGLWTDINCVDTTYEGNLVHANAEHGIHHEVSYSAVIRGNEVTGNGWGGDRVAGYGGAGIRIAASPDVVVTGNVLSGNQNAIMLIQQDRSEDSRGAGPHELANVRVTNNDVAMTGGAVGLMQDIRDQSYFSSRRIRFEGNTYRLANLGGRYFGWRDKLVNQSTWRDYGQDTSAKFLELDGA